jgi:hypothetical protein
MSDLQRVGPVFGGTGTAPPFTASITGGQRVNDAHGRYMDAVLSGRVFVASNQTLATLQTGLTTAQTGLGIYNPSTSGKYLVLLQASCVFTIAQPTTASVYGLCANTTTQQAAPTSQTAATVRNALLGSSSASGALALTAGTLAAAPVAVSVLGVAYTGAITVSTGVVPFYREYGGQLIVYPGSYLGFFCSVAPAATSFWGELVWEEIPALA